MCNKRRCIKSATARIISPLMNAVRIPLDFTMRRCFLYPPSSSRPTPYSCLTGRRPPLPPPPSLPSTCSPGVSVRLIKFYKRAIIFVYFISTSTYTLWTAENYLNSAGVNISDLTSYGFWWNISCKLKTMKFCIHAYSMGNYVMKILNLRARTRTSGRENLFIQFKVIIITYTMNVQ